MKIPFPKRIAPWHAGIFAALLCLIEILQGTQPVFAAGVFIYIVAATIAFNLAGGMNRPTGAFVMANAMLCLIIGQCVKVILGEPADSNLGAPLLTIAVYCGGMLSILAGVALSRRFLPEKALLERGDQDSRMSQIAITCTLLGISSGFILAVIGNAPGSIGAIFQQFGQFLPLGMLIAVYDCIRRSNGRKSINTIFVLGALFTILNGGILGTSKQALFTPIACYVIVCGALRYRFKPVNIAAFACILFVVVYYLVPYSQVVRNYTRTIGTYSEQIDAAEYWLSHIDAVRAEYTQANEDTAITYGPHYFTQSSAFLERLTMIVIDDRLIDVTQERGFEGPRPLIVGAENIIPHFIWAGKPDFVFNNSYAHEVGVLSEDDFNTSVSFSSSADAYHELGWAGVFLVMPILLGLMFYVVDAISGDVSHSPWGLTYTVLFFHAAPEMLLGIAFNVCTTFTFIVLVTAYAARYVFPLLGSFVVPERRKLAVVRALRTPAPPAAAPPSA